MTYSDNELSVSDAKPVELYRFVGTYDNYYYTSGTEKVSYQAPDDGIAHDYMPIAIKRSEIVIGTQDDDNTEITVQLKATNQIVLDYGFETSPPELNLTVFRFHDISDVKRIWFGEVTNIQTDDGVSTIRSPSLLSSIMSAQAPTVYYQSPCNNVLYDNRCKVLETSFSHAAIVTAVTGRQITLDGIGALDGMLKGGELLLEGGERRMIVAQTGDVISVNFPFSKLIPGTNCHIVAGCDHLWEGDCKNRFNNRRNFGGFRFIPPDNPFAVGIDPSANPIADHTCTAPRVVFDGWWMKAYLDYWQGTSGGPTEFPNFTLVMDGDGDGTVETNNGIATGFPWSPNPDYWTDDSGAHAVQQTSFTFLQAHWPVDFTRVARKWRLSLQFPAFSVSGASPEATLFVRRWDEAGYSPVGTVGIFSLWPADYDLFF